MYAVRPSLRLARLGYPYDMSLSTENPYMLVDVPGIMSNPGYEEMAIVEAQKAQGHVFVLEGEPRAV